MRSMSLFAAIAAALAGSAEASCLSPATESLAIAGDIKEGGLEGTFRRALDPASGRFTEAVELGIIKTGTGFDGHLAWSQDVSGASHYLTSDFARRLAISEAWLARYASCPAPASLQTSVHLGVDRVTGLDSWRVIPTGGAPLELLYDTRTERLDRATLRYSENRLIHHYADWRKIASGRLISFLQRDEDPEDESETVYTVRSVVSAGKPSFSPPPTPNDSRIIGGSSTSVRFEDDGGHRVYLLVYLDGKGPFAFELDNGGHFILASETAKELGLEQQGSFASTGAGNEIRRAGYVKIGKLRVGNAEVANQTAKVLSLSHNDRPGSRPRAGILGLEFFERFIVGVDHHNKTVSLRLHSSSSAAYPGRPLRLLFDEDAPLVSGAIDGNPGNIMLDIGNAGSTIIEDYWAKQHGLTAKLLSGAKIDSEWLSTAAVTLGPVTLEDQKIAYFGETERGSESTASVAAIAGEPLLSHFNAVYDYGHQRVWLDLLPGTSSRSVEKRH